MSYEFSDVIDVPPIPVSPDLAARQAVNQAAKIASAGGIDQGRTKALQAILDASPESEPSELLRLRLLYRLAYSEPELRQLIDRTFAQLGLV